MNCRIGKLATLLAAAALVVGIVAPASVQVFTGRIDVTVEDSTGGRLPGVAVDLTGPVSQSQVTDAQGQAHFLNLPVGIYAVKAALPGFAAWSNNEVQVATGSSTPLAVRLGVAGTAETVNVMAASPIIDIKRETTTTNVTLEELQNIPSARDPWVVMQTVPTIYVDRVNVGGAESGQQSTYVGKGSTTADNTWNIDGVPITDMGATGSSPTYYDFDMFQEMSITTGGSNAQNPTPGVQLNLVLKKGTNVPHGSTRYYFENEKLQGNNMDPALAKTIGGSSAECIASNYEKHCGNRTDKYQDYGVEIGGPLLKDRLWAWGTAGKTNPKIRTLTGTLDETILKNYGLKFDAQASSSVRGNFTYFLGDKVKFGRNAGPTRPPETSWNQTGPTKYYKGEGNFTFGQSLFAAARYAYISGGFSLTPQGGLDKDFYKDDNLVWHNSYYFYKTERPQYFAGGDASYFKGKHEAKFGFSWRKTPIDSISQVTGSKIITIHVGYPDMIAQAQQDWAQNTVGKYISAFVTDTISLDRLTIIAGLRFDRATSSYAATSVPAVAGFPLLPAVTAPAVEDAYKFNTVSPRVGITYALDDSRKTVARASYGMFASQLPGNAGGFVSAIQPYTYVYYAAVDRNGNRTADLNEIDFAGGVLGSNEVDLAHPGQKVVNNKVGDLKAPLTQELMFGVDRELIPNFGVSATFTYRHMNNFLWNPRNGVSQANYPRTGTFTGTFAEVGTVSIPLYGASVSQLGYHAENRPDYHQRYLGFELSATKRMSNRWMGRVGFGTTSHNEYFDSDAAILDRTRTPSASGQFQPYQQAGPLVDGGPVVVQTGGSGKSQIYLLPPKYQVSANGLYQGPWDINFGASLTARQGYGMPFFRDRVNASDPVLANKRVLLTQTVDQFRLDRVTTVDVRVEKLFKFADRANFAFDFDVFNLMNTATILGKEYNARAGTYNTVREIMNPRIARLGLRFFF